MPREDAPKSASSTPRIMNRWTVALAALGGLLLVAPLLGVLSMGAYGVPGARVTREGVQLVPRLSPEERRQRSTYQIPCQTDQDCEAPLVCFFNMRLGERYCADSSCITDAQCPPGFTCRSMPTGREDTELRVCTQVGLRKAGEECVLMPSTPRTGCEQGLVCNGWCGRPCRKDAPGSCPEGFFCAEGHEGPSCLPTCAGRNCPEGQQCIRWGQDVSVCQTVHGQDCQRNPCPEGQRCLSQSRPDKPGHVWMECVASCRDDRRACPEGLVCAHGECRSPCDAQRPDSCGEQYRCRKLLKDDPYACLPRLHVPR